MTVPPRISPGALHGLLEAGGELALLDVREQGVHSQGHPFHACNAPLSRLELVAPALLPRADVPIVLLDGGHEGLAERAARVLSGLGFSDVAILDGGVGGWRAAGYELFSGINVPSKAFGEYIEHHDDTPRIGPDALRALLDAGETPLIVDARPFDEYRRMNIPGAINVPGAELAWRIHDLAPDPRTLVVVHCAGRTRSIIGCQSLRNAGIDNPVVALRDGTMGWELAGYDCERGAAREAPPPSPAAAERARACAERVAARFGVRFVDGRTVRGWQHDAHRSLYLLDVRSPVEFARRHIAGSRHAPGGQLVQATDAYIAVRAARIVLVDPRQVRAVMTASWLEQMGLPDVHVLRPEGDDGFDGWPTAEGAAAASARQDAAPPWRSVDPHALAARLGRRGVAVLDFASSLQHRARHVAGAWWAVRSRLDDAHAALASLGELREIVVTADDPELARLAAPDVAARWPGLEVAVLDGGNRRWFDAGLPVSDGLERATTTTDDVWYRPYDQPADQARHARDYLAWEVALAGQIERDPTVRFVRFPSS